MVRIYKNLHDRNGRKGGVRLFARSISIQITFEGRFMYSPEPDDFLWELCNVALLNANRNFQLEFARVFCQVLIFIFANKARYDQLSKTSSVSETCYLTIILRNRAEYRLILSR